MRPMLATPAAQVPAGPGWAHEVKWDGMRVLVESKAGVVQVFSRTERNVTIAFPELVRPDAGLLEHDGLLLDGEIVVMRDGLPSFSALAERFNVTDSSVAEQLAASAPVTLMAFDVLRVLNQPTISLPLERRRELLEVSELGSRWIQVPPTFSDGAMLLSATLEQGIEGVVAKRLSSSYSPGTRSEHWRKIVNRRTDSFVVGGWLPETDRNVLGSLLIGTPSPLGLVFCGRIGSGLVGAAGARLLPQLQAIATADSPFVQNPPAVRGKLATWTRPELVVDLEFHGWTESGNLRQPSWRGIRSDLTPADLERTEPPHA